MRFSANVSILFKEVPFLERFGRAAATGFSTIEFWWPSGEDPGAVEKAVKDVNLQVALMNFDAGDMAAGDRGLVGDPEREGRFRENVPVALELARSLGCKRLNVLVGHALAGMDREEQLALARRNVGFAADEGRKVGIEVLVEAVNTFENGPYLLRTTEGAVRFVRGVGRGNVKVQHDLYHMQRMEGNLVANLREHVGLGRAKSTTPTSSPPSKSWATMAMSASSTTRRPRPPRRALVGYRRTCGTKTWRSGI
jgi:hydroxypyruvate isomerase